VGERSLQKKKTIAVFGFDCASHFHHTFYSESTYLGVFHIHFLFKCFLSLTCARMPYGVTLPLFSPLLFSLHRFSFFLFSRMLAYTSNPSSLLTPLVQHYQDDWYILDSSEKKGEEFVLVYYRGRNDAWDGYGGGFLYTRAPECPEAIKPRVAAALEKGISLTLLFFQRLFTEALLLSNSINNLQRGAAETRRAFYCFPFVW